ncbi:TPA: hypothetical protein DCW38_05245 [candidate division WOR-3 bacterium]|jgi:Xaa-Pro aminopeptidase|uniref:Peptidase M24 domain-containing protein n=1 Tax=candidate division WOR-3 bacterium TaxID=2052148 RepID=A0A350HAK4_UNCW3|nr:hypothetical protein [candidate division WOR-3 bacterium]
MERKIKIVQRVLKDHEMLLLDNPQEVFDLAGFKTSFNLGEYDASMLLGRKKVFIVCDQLLYPYIEKISGVNVVKGDSFEYLKNNKLFVTEWKKILKENKITKLGLVNMSLEGAFREFNTFHFLSPSRTLGKIKEGKEILEIKSLAKTMKRIFTSAEKFLVKDMTDINLRNMIDEEIYSLGCDRRYLPTYVGFDAKSIYPTLSADTLKNGSLVLIDAGIMKKGIGLSYSSTLKFGAPSKEKEKLYRTAKDGLEVILSKINKSSSPLNADMAYREFLSRHKFLNNSLEYAVSFIESAQGGEVNSVTDSSGFAEGQIVKATSSIFIPGISGVRIEGIVLVKGKSHEKIL